MANGNGNNNDCHGYAKGKIVCPGCGRWVEPYEGLMCFSCARNYEQGAVDALLAGNVITEVAWLFQMARRHLTDAAANLARLDREYSVLQSSTLDEAEQKISQIPGSAKLNERVRNEAARKLQPGIWGERGGNRLHFMREVTRQEWESLSTAMDHLAARYPDDVRTVVKGQEADAA